MLKRLLHSTKPSLLLRQARTHCPKPTPFIIPSKFRRHYTTQTNILPKGVLPEDIGYPPDFAEVAEKVRHRFAPVKDPEARLFKVEPEPPKEKPKKPIKRQKTRLTAADVPKYDPKEVAKWPQTEVLLRRVRGSTWKMRRIARLISGLSCREALTQLEFHTHMPHARAALKLVRNVMYNAENNHNMNADRLLISMCFC